MSTRRVPLSANPNVANSPLRGAAALAAAATASKQKRSYARTQREEAYGQPPPAKRQMLDGGVKSAQRSPSKQKPQAQRGASRSYASASERAAHQAAQYKPTEKEVENIRKWQQSQRSKFPKFVFYFESVPDDLRARLAKQVAHLGAREEKFFSIDITHVITTRPIPPEKPKDENVEPVETTEHEQPQTINPSLLSRSADPAASSVSTKRRLFENMAARRLPVQVQEDVVRRPKPGLRNADVLHRARDMGKKIWSLDKLHKILEVLFEADPYRSATLAISSRLGSPGNAGNGAGQSRLAEDQLLQLLHKERVSGPSDRDPTVSTRELTYFKGPYIYIYDIEEKQKPIMVREYPKVADRTDGEWPQLRSSGNGRCPFLEDADSAERRQTRAKEPAARPTVEKVPKLQPPDVAPPKPVTGKRTLAEMEDAHNRRAPPTEVFDAVKPTVPPAVDFQPQNAFTSRARAGRLLAGEPVASGVQPSGITSAIRSQMISSATGTLSSKAGTSKEIHSLQRKVLQKSAPTSQDLSSRRMADMGMDRPSFIRSTSLGHPAQSKLDVIGENGSAREEKHRRTMSVPVQAPKQKKRDPKPGYCENCQDKFEDFEDHIVTHKHRKFAENDRNWGELDALLGNLKRTPRYTADGDDSDNDW